MTRWRFGRVVSYHKLKLNRIGYKRLGIDNGAKIIITDIIEHPRSVKGNFLLFPSTKTKFAEGDIVMYKPKDGRISSIKKII